MTLRWISKQGRYQHFEILVLGKWRVGQVYYDGATSNEKKYRATIALPGPNQEVGYFSTEEKAMNTLEEEVKRWWKGAVDG